MGRGGWQIPKNQGKLDLKRVFSRDIPSVILLIGFSVINIE
jgi:hypothetical protein